MSWSEDDPQSIKHKVHHHSPPSNLTSSSSSSHPSATVSPYDRFTCLVTSLVCGVVFWGKCVWKKKKQQHWFDFFILAFYFVQQVWTAWHLCGILSVSLNYFCVLTETMLWMSVYGCNIYILHADTRICLKKKKVVARFSHRNVSLLLLLGAVLISNAPLFFLLLNKGTVTQSSSQKHHRTLLSPSLHLLGCNTSAQLSVPSSSVYPTLPNTTCFSLPKNCMVICHVVSNHWFECSVFLIHSAWTFASSVLVCNNQMFLYGVVTWRLAGSERARLTGTAEPRWKKNHFLAR